MGNLSRQDQAIRAPQSRQRRNSPFSSFRGVVSLRCRHQKPMEPWRLKWQLFSSGAACSFLVPAFNGDAAVCSTTARRDCSPLELHHSSLGRSVLPCRNRLDLYSSFITLGPCKCQFRTAHTYGRNCSSRAKSRNLPFLLHRAESTGRRRPLPRPPSILVRLPRGTEQSPAVRDSSAVSLPQRLSSKPTGKTRNKTGRQARLPSEGFSVRINFWHTLGQHVC